MVNKKQERIIKELKMLQSSNDREEAHSMADDLILSLLPKEIVEEYNKIEKWYA